MSHVKETTLLEYVIAYLQEELQERGKHVRYREDVEQLVDMALDAYAGGAR